jgi:hypothetical protein
MLKMPCTTETIYRPSFSRGLKSIRRLFTDGEVRPKSDKKALFQRELCKYSVKERSWLHKKKSLGIFIRVERSEKPFLSATFRVAASSRIKIVQAFLHKKMAKWPTINGPMAIFVIQHLGKRGLQSVKLLDTCLGQKKGLSN